MKKFLVYSAVVGLCLCAASSLMAERQYPAEKAAAEATATDVQSSTDRVRVLDEPVQTARTKNTRALGSITYDDGVVTAAPGTASYCYGNQFNTWSGNSMMVSGSVTAMSFYMQGQGGGAAFLSVFSPVVGATAPNITSVSVPVTTGWNTHVFAAPVPYVGSSFLAGVWYFGGDSVGLGSGTTGAQGHHGMIVNDFSGTGFALLTSLNALVTASGDVLPVELMSFQVE